MIPRVLLFWLLVALTTGQSLATTRHPGFGAVPGYRPLPLANGAGVEQSAVWRGRWVDITGYYQIGLRPYDPVAGKWLTYDSVWNERDPNWYTFAGGEPIMRFDADGRLATTAVNYGIGVGQGFLQGTTGISTGNPTGTANYDGQLAGRDLSLVASAWMTAQGLTITGGGETVMAGGAAVELASGGTATLGAGPVIGAGALTTAGGVLETGIGLFGLYNFMNLQPLQSPSKDSGGGESQNSSGQPSSSGQSSTPTDSGNVDLTDSQGSQHILDGDATGGGHAPGTGIPGKSEFPATWSNDQILNTISDIATDPDQVWSPPDSRGYVTTTATVDGVDIKVVVDTNKGRIVTGYPTNLPRNP
jgi:RHS repeat-associated protein